MFMVSISLPQKMQGWKYSPKRRCRRHCSMSYKYKTCVDNSQVDNTRFVYSMGGEAMEFIGRQAELLFLERCYRSPQAQLVVLYGRRRVGKTETSRRFSRDKPCIFYSCTQETDAAVLAGFSRRLLLRDTRASRFISTYATWEAAFESIPSLDMTGRKLVIIDEFPYACLANKSLPSILQTSKVPSISHVS